MTNSILIFTLCFLFYVFFLAPSWYETKLRENNIKQEDIQQQFTTPEDYPSLLYVKDKRVYYYDCSKKIFEQIQSNNILDVKVEKHYTASEKKVNVSKLEVLVITGKKIYSVNTFGSYVNRDKNKLEILSGLIKSNISYNIK
ncbi:hypothetical protein [Intestinibacter sp.]